MSRAAALLLLAAAIGAGESAGWWPPFVPREAPVPPAPAVKGELLVIDRPEMAGISGLRADWDRPIIVADGGATRGAAVVDAVHRSLLLRFPDAAERLAKAMAAGKAVARLELVLPFAGTELYPTGYLKPAGMSFLGRTWDDRQPNWHVVAWALRVPWQADAKHGPTYNASANGIAYWARFGAADAQRDRHPAAYGPTEVSSRQPEGRIDLTALLSDRAYGDTPMVRLRRFSDQGVLLRKLEVYDASFWTGGYEWATATGPRGILLKAPRLEAVLKPGPAAKLDLPPPAKPQAGGAPTAVLPSGAALAALLKRHAFRQPAWMDDGQWTRIQQLAAFGNRAAFPADEAAYLAWIDQLLGRAPRRWAGFDAAEVNEIARRYGDAMPAPVLDHLRLYWWAWLLPDRDIGALVQGYIGGQEAAAYYGRTRDWRGNFSVYRTYCHNQGTMNFNHWATIGTLAGAWLLGEPRLLADGRTGLERYCLRMWSWADGSTQESIDHYYLAHSLTAQKGLADFAPGHAERMIGRSILAKGVSELVTLYHPGLRRFTSTSGRTGVAYPLIIQDGLQHIVHTIDPRGALTDAGSTTVEDGVPVIGHDVAPGLVASQTLARPWAPAWYGGLITNRVLPDEVTTAYTKWGRHRNRPLWKRSWIAPGWGLASLDLPINETVPFLLHWSRASGPVTSYRGLGTLLGRYGVDRTELLDSIAHGTGANNANGIVGVQGGLVQCFQHRARLLLFASPSPGLKPPDADRPLPTKPTSLQLTLGIFAFAGTPKISIDGKTAALPARCLPGQRIVLHDGSARIAILPLLISDLGRDAAVEITASGVATAMQGGGRLAETLRIDLINLRGKPAPRLDAAELDQAHVVCGLTATTAEETPDLAAWEASLAKRKPQAAWNPAKRLVLAQWKGEDGTMQAAWSPVAAGDAPDSIFPERTVDGRSPYPRNGLMRTGNHIVQGTGELAVGGARLELDGGRTGLLLVDPVNSCCEGWNSLPEPSAFRLSGPGGVSAASDGKVSTCRVLLDAKNGRVEVDAALVEGGARSLRVSGMKVVTLIVNGRVIDKPGAAIDLTVTPVEPGEELLATPAPAVRSKPSRPVPVARPATPPPSLTDPAIQTHWDARLFQALNAAIATGGRPQFLSDTMRQAVQVEAIDADGSLALRAGASVVHVAWRRLSVSERAALAVDLTLIDRSLNAMAGFWLLLAGDREAADAQLSKAGAAAAEVRAVFAQTPSGD
jgi:hypothetical protein